MKKRLLILIMLLIALPMVFFSGCSKEAEELAATAINEVSKTVQEETSSKDNSETKEDEVSPEDEEDASEEEEAEIPEETISEYGEYSDPYEVAEYLYTYHHLPSNYITKDEAEDLGWNSSKGNLWDVAEGMSIGGDRFGNYEKQLPKGNYHECDVNYEGGFRGSERLIYSDEFEIYYTQDHYESFIQLY
ncbi:MAG: ribonuclease [Firmicutes bacterium]|nr:ribonuclease [Bacillota bacterium]